MPEGKVHSEFTELQGIPVLISQDETGTVTLRTNNHVAQTIFDRKLKCLTVNDDSYDTDDKVSLKELMEMLRAELKK